RLPRRYGEGRMVPGPPLRPAPDARDAMRAQPRDLAAQGPLDEGGLAAGRGRPPPPPRSPVARGHSGLPVALARTRSHRIAVRGLRRPASAFGPLFSASGPRSILARPLLAAGLAAPPRPRVASLPP